jgi:hypothetical protein
MINTRLVEIEARHRYGELQRDADRRRLARSVARPPFAARRLAAFAAGVVGRRGLLLGGAVLACGAGGAAAQSGPSSAAPAHL